MAALFQPRAKLLCSGVEIPVHNLEVRFDPSNVDVRATVLEPFEQQTEMTLQFFDGAVLKSLRVQDCFVRELGRTRLFDLLLSSQGVPDFWEKQAMTAEQWDVSTDPVAMLETVKDRASARKLELFGDACYLNEKGGMHFKDMEKRHALGYARLWTDDTPFRLASVLLREIFGSPFAPDPAYLRCGDENCCAVPKGTCANCLLFRWRTWNDSTAFNVAARIYEERRWEDMPILADALEQADCEDADILAHCRGMVRCHFCDGRGRVGREFLSVESGMDYVGLKCSPCKGEGWIAKPVACTRGCWVVDFLLGKT